MRQRGVFLVTGLVLIAVSCGWAQQQQQDIAPLNLSGNLGVGYSALHTSNLSSSSPIATADADLLGYWRDPRILFFDFAPFVSSGNSVANASDLVNRGKGFSATTTMLGGSPFPVTITYSRLWQDYPGYLLTGNLLSGAATSFASNDFGIDWGLYWRKLPPVSFHYGTSGNDTEIPTVAGNSSHVHTDTFSVNSHYSLAAWNLDAGYNRSNLDATRFDLLNLNGPTQPESSHTSELHAGADRALPLQSHLDLIGGERQWNDNTAIVQSDSTYDYARILANSHPFTRLHLNFSGGYTSNQNAAAIQQALGTSSTVPGSLLISPTLASGHTIDYGGGGLFVLPRGFSASGNVTAGRLSTPSALNEEILAWSVGLNYMHNLGHSGSLTASYFYQDAQSGGATSTTRTLRAGVSTLVPHQVQLGASMHFDQSDFENHVPLLPGIESPSHGYGFTLNAGRPMARGWRIAGDVDVDRHVTEFPVNVTATTKSFGVRADSTSWELMVRRSYHSGLAIQVGNGLVFVNNPDLALRTPLGTVLSLNSNVQTMLIGAFRPGRKRFGVSGSLVRFGYDNAGRHVTNATLFDANLSYRLRRLTMQTGYRFATSRVYTLSTSAFDRREFYFEVLRHFQVF